MQLYCTLYIFLIEFMSFAETLRHPTQAAASLLKATQIDRLGGNYEF